MLAGLTDVTVLVDADLVVRWHSPAAARQFGLDRTDLLDQPLSAVLHPQDALVVAARLRTVLTSGIPAGRTVLIEARLRDGLGRWRETESAVSDLRTVPEVSALVLQIRDIGARTDPVPSAHRLTWTDELTGLANRRKLLHAATELRAAAGTGGMILRIGLPGCGDALQGLDRADQDLILVEAGRRLGELTGTVDLAARLGDDDFAVLLGSAPVPAYARATRMIAALSEPYALATATVRMPTAAGLACLGTGSDVTDVLRRADLARRRAAQLGPGRAECYDESIEAALVRRMTIERELPGAVERDELDLVYQPVLDLREHQPVGVEALLRWRNPQLGMVHPADIISAAEALDLDQQIGEWVLNQACRQLATWRTNGRDLWMSINISIRQLRSDDFSRAVTTATDANSIPADRLLIEVAEPSLGDTCLEATGGDLPDPPTDETGAAARSVPHMLRKLRATGVRIALDHFGTGRAALAHLRRLPIDAIKIDRTLFLGPSGERDPGSPVLEAVVEMGRRLGFDVIATGLEDNTHRTLALAAGCYLGEGFLLAPPSHAEHVEAFLESHRMPRFC